MRLNALGDYRRAVTVARRTGAPSLPAALASVLRARARYGIGPRFHSLFGLAGRPVAEWRTFVLNGEFNPIILAVNGTANLPLADDKVAFAAHCRAAGLPTVPISCIIAPPRGRRAEGIPVATDAAALAAVLENAPEHVFVKPVHGTHGEGAFAVERGPDGTLRFAGRTGTAADLFRYCAARSDGGLGWLVQPAVVPHPELAPLMPAALGTVRVVTWLDGSEPRVLFPVLRIPVGWTPVDNFGDGTGGNIVAAIDLASGMLRRGWVSRSRVWPEMVAIERHPDTGCPIEGLRLPRWQETLALVCEAQRRTPLLRTLGWDVGITASGPLIVEANPNYGVHLLQVAYGRGIRAELAPIMALRGRGAGRRG